jgi:hypothetical protein
MPENTVPFIVVNKRRKVRYMNQEKFEHLKNRCLDIEEIAQNLPEVYLEILETSRLVNR